VVETAIIGTLAAGAGEGMVEGGEDLDQDQDQGQVGIVTTTVTTVLETAGERLDEDVDEDVVPGVFLRHEDEGGDGDGAEEVHLQREELSLFLLTMVCPFLHFLIRN
jgi:hypothetical protein